MAGTAGAAFAAAVSVVRVFEEDGVAAATAGVGLAAGVALGLAAAVSEERVFEGVGVAAVATAAAGVVLAEAGFAVALSATRVLEGVGVAAAATAGVGFAGAAGVFAIRVSPECVELAGDSAGSVLGRASVGRASAGGAGSVRMACGVTRKLTLGAAGFGGALGACAFSHCCR